MFFRRPWHSYIFAKTSAVFEALYIVRLQERKGEGRKPVHVTFNPVIVSSFAAAGKSSTYDKGPVSSPSSFTS